MENSGQSAMTIERLDAYLDLKREIHMLENSIKKLTEQTLVPVSDSVHGSMPEYPYIKCVVKITGLDADTMERLERRKIRLAERCKKARKDVEEIEAWVETIQDSVVRQIVELRYIQGESWIYTARRLGYKSDSGVRMALTRYLEKNKSCAVCAIPL